MAVLGLLIGFTNMFHPLSNFTFLNYEQLNDYLYPGIGLVYLTSVDLTGVFSCCIRKCFDVHAIHVGALRNGMHSCCRLLCGC